MIPPARRNSSIINAYIQTKLEMELGLQVKSYQNIEDTIVKRRSQIKAVNPKAKTAKGKEDASKNLARTERVKHMTEHKIPLEELFQMLKTDPEKGLTNEEAFIKNKELGDNVLIEKSRTPWYFKLLKEFCNTFAILLWIASILSFVTYALTPIDPSNMYLGIILAAVIIVSGLCSYYQNFKAEAIMETFKNFIPLQVKVVRDGTVRNMMAAKIVPGDIVIIKEGDSIPADLRIIQSAEMKVDNSSLTGESDPQPRSVECTDFENPLETKNLCFFGTLCKQGTGKGVVISIADNTVLGQIADLAANTKIGETNFQKEINRMIALAAVLASFMSIFFFAIGFDLGYDFIENLLFGIGFLVANAPEGLLITLTVCLTLCAKNLATKFVLVKNLQTVETLGSTTTICSDKTGTLTQNKMSVENLWYDGKVMKGTNFQKFNREKGKYPSMKLDYDYQSTSFKTLQSVAVLSSEAVFDSDQSVSRQTGARRGSVTEKKVVGDASETALVTFFQSIEDIAATRKRNRLIKVQGNECRVAFNSNNKFAFSIVSDEDKESGSLYSLVMKGAPERIWKFCSKIMMDGKEVPIDENMKKEFEAANMFFAKNGQRVLGFAKTSFSPKRFHKDEFFMDYPFNTASVTALAPDYKEWNFPIVGLTFVGLISLIDPPRPAVPYSILKCKTAGIKVIMVTGDHPITAQAIAKQVNILDKTIKTNLDLEEELKLSPDEAIMRAEAIVIHGDQISKATSDDSLLPPNERGRVIEYWLSKKYIVFARTSPSQKLIIVSACQARGEIVAVTGDGVNDSPAIKKADVGIAMGITGSDVAKDAADLVLMTDDFASLVVGIQEGRRLYDNLKKAVSYSLTTNIPEIIPYFMLMVFGFPVPITTMCMLFLCNGTDICPAISCAYEDSELDIMIRRPRERHEHLITRKLMTFCYLQIGVFESFACFITYFTVLADFGFPIQSVFNLGLKTGFAHNSGDVYDPNDQYFGNTAITGGCQGIDQLADGTISNYSPDWYLNGDTYTDLRMVYVACAYDMNGQLTGALTSTLEYWPCKFRQISPYSHRPACYSTESGKYAQTAYFVSVILCQMANIVIHKTRRSSLYQHTLNNYFQMWGLIFEVMIGLTLSYIPALNSGLNTRDIDFYHFGVPALPFVLMILLYNEGRLFLVSRSIQNVKPNERPGWWWRNYVW